MNCKYFFYLYPCIKESACMLSRLSQLHFFIKSIDITDSGNICCHLWLCECFGAVCWLVLDHRSDCLDDLSRLSLRTESAKSFQIFCECQAILV